jgi:C4-type Zn-finger protein
MTLHETCTAAPQAGRFKLPSCPVCTEILLAPMMAEHVNEHLVRNHWVCESCGHAFRKSVKLVRRDARDRLALFCV